MQFSFLIAIMQGCTTYTQPSQGCGNIAKIIVYIVCNTRKVCTYNSQHLAKCTYQNTSLQKACYNHTMLWEPCCNLELSIWQCKGERETLLLLLLCI